MNRDTVIGLNIVLIIELKHYNSEVKNMKVFVRFVLLLSMLLVYVSTSVYADSDVSIAREYVSSDTGYDEIAALTGEIADRINSTLATENEEHAYGSEDHDYITAADIDLADMYKVYVSPDLFSGEIMSRNLESALGDSDYVWVYPFEIDNLTIKITLQKGLPLSQAAAMAVDDNGNDLLTIADKNKIQSEAGNWKLISSSIDYANNSYEESISAAALENAVLDSTSEVSVDVYFVSIPELHCEAAVYATGNNYGIRLLSDKAEELIGGIASENGFYSLDTVYNIDTVRQYITNNATASYTNSDGEYVYGGLSKAHNADDASIAVVVASGIVAAICALALLCIWVKLRAAKQAK